MRDRDEEELARAIHSLTHVLSDILSEQRIQFQWMVSHHHFATKTDIENLKEDLSMKLSLIKTAVTDAARANREAFTELGTKIADLNTQIQDLKDAATDPDVTDQQFLADLQTLQNDAKALADIVPGSPSGEPPSDGTGVTPPDAPDQTPDRRFRG